MKKKTMHSCTSYNNYFPYGLREHTQKKCFFGGRTTMVRVAPPPLELSGS